MKVKNIGSNQTEVETSRYVILVSYQTNVAYQDKETGLFFKTSKKWSNTTSKHITRWLDGRNAAAIDQKVLDELI